jgi:FkbM family methyltransferase
MKIIQIGANSGNDSVTEFIKQNLIDVELAILVEPIPFVLDKLKQCYKNNTNVIIEPIAITDSDTDETLELFFEMDSINYEVCSFSKNHLIEHGCPIDKIDSISVPALSINRLMDKYDLKELDHLFIDTEGLDVHIICSLDFEKYKFKEIVFESAHTDGTRIQRENYKKIVNYLQSLNYIIENIDGLNSRAKLIN